MSKLNEGTGGSGSYDLGIQVPPKGDYIWQFQEGSGKDGKGGVEKWVDDSDPEKFAIKLGVKVVKVIEGSDEAIDGNGTFFCGNNKGGEKQLLAILDLTGLIKEATAKWGSEAELSDLMGDEKFVNFLKLKLPGKIIGASHIVVTTKGTGSNEGKEFNNVRFTKVFPPAGAAPKGAGAGTASQTKFED